MLIKERLITKGAIIAILVPICLVALSFSYFYRARLELGHWPTYGNPDPKEFNWWLHHSLIYFFILLCYPAAGWILLSAAALFYKKRIWKALLILALGTLSFWAVFELSATSIGDQFWEWFID